MRNPEGPATNFLLTEWRANRLTHSLAGVQSIKELRAPMSLFEAYENELREAHDGIITTPFPFALPFKGLPLVDEPDNDNGWYLRVVTR
jgi:hypothetical protein